MNTSTRNRTLLLATAMVISITASTRLKADTGVCGGASLTLPFTDVPSTNAFFCSIAEAYLSGLSNGTSATTYSPSSTVPREQMAAFTTRTLDQTLRRGSKRAALRRFWTNAGGAELALTAVGSIPRLLASDGGDLWVASQGSDSVTRVRASDGKKLEEWTGATGAAGTLVAMGKIFVIGNTNPGSLYQIDPAQPAGGVTTLSSVLGNSPVGIAFDGERIWTTNSDQVTETGSISIVTVNPPSVTTLTSGFVDPWGIVYDGANIWITDLGDNLVKKLDVNGNILMSVSLPSLVRGPLSPAFDGTNIWVPCAGGSGFVVVIRATGSLAGTVLAKLSGNGLVGPMQAAFDGERIMVTNYFAHSVSLWKASDLTPIGTFATGPNAVPFGVCSDGLNFWITLQDSDKLARF